MSSITIEGGVYRIFQEHLGSSVSGEILAVTAEELQHIDEYETMAYRRVKVVLRSGMMAWIYQK